MKESLERLSQDLAAAWRSGRTIPLPPSSEAPGTRSEAYVVQDRMARLIGGKVAGWKVGATVRAVQLFEGHDGPLPGRIFADRCFDSPASFTAGFVTGAKIECEFAFRLKARLPSSAKSIEPAALADVLTFHPAIEIAGSRYAPGTSNRAPTTFDGIADNGSGGAAVLGPAVEDWRDLPFETMDVDARIDDSPAIQVYSGAYRRDPLAIAAETFSDLIARGIEPEPGAILLTGSLTLPTPLRRGQTLVARFAEFPPLTLTLT